MAHDQVPGRGPHPRGRGLQRRGRDGLDAHDASGSIGMLANHAPLLAMLEPTELRLYSPRPRSSASRRPRATCRSPTTARCCWSRRRIAPDELDAAELRERLQQAERELEAAGEDTERRRVAQRDQPPARAFLQIAQG